MSRKHPGRDTEFAKWESFMAKLDAQMRRDEEEFKRLENSKSNKKNKNK